MNQDLVVQFARDAIMTCLLMSAPVLGAALIIGLVVGIFQAVTQINEMTLSFVPKILGIFIALAIFGPWMMNTMLSYTAKLINFLPYLVR